MMYDEIVEKLKIRAPVSSRDVNAVQMFRLYQDRYLKYVEYHNNQYELNVIPLEEGEHHIYEMIRSTDSFKVFTELVETFIKNTQNNKRSFLMCDHKEYEIILELMESSE